MELTVYTIQGKETTKKVQFKDEVFNIEPHDHAIYLDVKHYMANQRQGTHKAKERGEVKGSTRKIKRQKGTGTARAGDIKNPLFRGGGRVFGPRPRNYDFKLNRKLKRLARKSALTYKAIDKAILVIEDFDFDQPKTKDFAQILSDLDLKNKKILLVLAESNKNVYLSSRNLKGVNVVTSSQLSTYEILDAHKLVLVESTIDEIERIHA